jgi:hypothetical protein
LTITALRHELSAAGQNVTLPSTMSGHGAVGVGTPPGGGGGGGGGGSSVVDPVSEGSGQSWRNSVDIGAGSQASTNSAGTSFFTRHLHPGTWASSDDDPPSCGGTSRESASHLDDLRLQSNETTDRSQSVITFFDL